MIKVSQRAEEAIKVFLIEWWNDLSWKVRETVAGEQIRIMEVDELYGQLFGHTLQEIAAAAEGLLPDNDDTRGEILEACQQVCEWMWARPAMPASYSIPNAWWESDLGFIVLQAHFWAMQDELITLTQASALTGRSLSGLGAMVDRGKITGYRDPGEPNSRRRTRVSKREIMQLPPLKRG